MVAPLGDSSIVFVCIGNSVNRVVVLGGVGKLC